MSVPSVVRRAVADLTERAGEMIERGPTENATARELLKQATDMDPEYAPAHALEAEGIAHWVAFFGGPWEALGPGILASSRALEVDPEFAEAHLARGLVLERAGRLDDAARSYRAFLRLCPGHAEGAARLARVIFLAGDFKGALEWAHERQKEGVRSRPDMLRELAMVWHCLGEHDRGDDLYRQTLEADPDDRFARSSRVYFSFVTGRLDRAVREARSMVEREPDVFIARGAFADAVLATGDIAAALPLYEKCYSIDPDSRNWGILRATRTVLGFTHLRAGDASRGRRLLDAAERETRKALGAGSRYGGLHYDLASIHAARGEREQALTWLERSCEAGWLQHEFLGLDPVFASFRGHERFETVRKAMRREVEEQRKQVT